MHDVLAYVQTLRYGRSGPGWHWLVLARPATAQPDGDARSHPPTLADHHGDYSAVGTAR
jgi:hypothetical protein